MATCAVCNSELNSSATCAKCNARGLTNLWVPLGRAFVAGASAILGYWLIVLAILNVGKAVASYWMPIPQSLAFLGMPSTASSVLELGFGGSVTAEYVDSKALVGSLSALLLIVPITYFYLLRAVVKRLVGGPVKPLLLGLATGFGSLATLHFLADFTSAQIVWGSGESATKLGFSSAIALLFAFLIGFSSVPGAVAATPLRVIAPWAGTVNKAFRGLLKTLVWVVMVSAAYYAFTMGTQLTNAVEIWAWIVALGAIALALPSMSVLMAPLLLGASIATFSNPVVDSMISQGYETWQHWLVIGISWMAVVVSAVRSAYKGTQAPFLWWRNTLISIAFGAVVVWLGGVHLSAPIDLSWYPTTGQFAAPLLTIAVFALAGLVHGIIGHPALAGMNTFLVEKVGSAIAKVGSKVNFVVRLQWVPILNQIKRSVAAFPFTLRKLIKYTLVLSTIGLAYLSGGPVASALAPFYDSENYSDGRFASSLVSGSVEGLPELGSYGGYVTYLSSEGLGQSAQVKIIDPQDEEYAKDKRDFDQKIAAKKANHEELTSEDVYTPAPDSHQRKVSWDNGKYFVVLQYSRSTAKAPFLTAIPQWDVAIVDSKLPKLTLKNGTANMRLVAVGNKSYSISNVFILPGKVTLKAGVDNSHFLMSNSVTVDASKDALALFNITFDQAKTEQLQNSVQKALREEYPGCDPLTFVVKGKIALGAVDASTGLPSLSLNGGGKCTAKDPYSGKLNTLPYDAKVTGKYNSTSEEWNWTWSIR